MNNLLAFHRSAFRRTRLIIHSYSLTKRVPFLSLWGASSRVSTVSAYIPYKIH